MNKISLVNGIWRLGEITRLVSLQMLLYTSNTRYKEFRYEQAKYVGASLRILINYYLLSIFYILGQVVIISLNVFQIYNFANAMDSF